MPNGAKHWAYTLNNYTDDELQSLSLLPSTASYHVFGFETSETGTPHLQGHLSFEKRKSLPWLKKNISQRANFSICRSVPASVLYCKKGGDYREFGKSTDVTRGKRNDLEEFKRSVRSGTFDLESIREQHSQVYARYPRFCLEYIRDHKPKKAVEQHELRDWQSELESKLRSDPCPRTIFFVVDFSGNAGKSWFVDWYVQQHQQSVVILPGKKPDMVYSLATCGFDPRVIFVDCPRSKQGDFIQYDFLEELKNGRVFCSKYESHMMYFDVPHVVVMMNEEPDYSKLSDDRYEVIKLD